tara:strand:- start:5321 stop:6727 length:1407 start_codon:yes stop_codon:yes gene_type:complete
LGAGYVGGPTMAVIASNCPDVQVTVVDINDNQISKWNDDNLKNLPVFEPGLAELVERTRFKNLHFSTNIEESIKKADMVFISVNTPTKKKGIGAGNASDLRWIESSARLVNRYAQGYTIVVEKSTVPVKTAAAIEVILKSISSDLNELENHKSFDVLSNPEFLAEGSAIKDLQQPDRVLIGGHKKSAIEALEKLYLKWVPGEKIIKTNLWSSELSKLTANAFLAQRVSSINAISQLCEVTGADVQEVAKAIGKDSRIGSRFLNSGPGFGGSCFKKDILNLVYLCNHFGLSEVANYWEQVISINQHQQNRIYRVIVNKLFDNLSEKKIAILGFAFKANTNDTRESPAIEICQKLLEEGAVLAIHDPKVSELKISQDLGKKPYISRDNKLKSNMNGVWSYAKDIEESLISADAALILCEWDIYRKVDWNQMSKIMRSPSWLFDTRNIVDEYSVDRTKINLWKVGKGNLNE